MIERERTISGEINKYPKWMNTVQEGLDRAGSHNDIKRRKIQGNFEFLDLEPTANIFSV